MLLLGRQACHSCGSSPAPSASASPHALTVHAAFLLSSSPAFLPLQPEAYVSKLVIVPGIITAASRPKHKATYITLQCKECRATKRIACRPGVGGAMVPRLCDAAALPGQANQCGQDPYLVLADRSECVDQQTLKMQERPEDVPTGDLPRSTMCLVDRRLVGAVSPGTRVTAVGILSIFQGKEGECPAGWLLDGCQ
jgi:DNA replicative helicase MCM subunit Mcm2 (Cdc46/Mcm family)